MKKEMKSTVKAAGASVKETAKKTEETTVKETVKETVKKAEPAENTVKKAQEAVKKAEPAKQTAEKAVRSTAKKAPAKKAVTETVYLQYLGKEINKDDLLLQVKALWAQDHQETEMETIKLYLKPEENAAYFVVNDEFSGKLEF